MEIDLQTLLDDYEIGALKQRLNDDLQKVARAVQRTGNDGALTIKIALKAGGGHKVRIAIAADAKVPRPTPEVTEAFVNDRNGLLQYGNPDQKQIDFKIETEKPEPRGEM
jgi:hypothetical protein